jgi:hypothetical protein
MGEVCSSLGTGAINLVSVYNITTVALAQATARKPLIQHVQRFTRSVPNSEGERLETNQKAIDGPMGDCNMQLSKRFFLQTNQADFRRLGLDWATTDPMEFPPWEAIT